MLYIIYWKIDLFYRLIVKIKKKAVEKFLTKKILITGKINNYYYYNPYVYKQIIYIVYFNN